MEKTGGSNAGAVYRFQRAAGGQWQEKQKIRAQDTQASDYFGYSVAIDGDWVIVGARGAAYLCPNEGRIPELEAQIAALKARIDKGVALPMSLLHTDPYGLTLSGALLGFAYSKDAPQLFDSATGKLALYFRGANEQFFAAYYDTHSVKAQYQLTTNATDSNKKTVACIARAAEIGKVSLSVSGSSDTTCTLTIANSATGITETWNYLPRAALAFADVLNGISAGQREFVGKLENALGSGTVSSLTLSKNSRRSLQPGDTLLVGDTGGDAGGDTGGDTLKVRVSGSVSGSNTIAIESVQLAAAIPENAPVYHLPYNYDDATTNTGGYRLRNGSLHFRVDSGSAKGKVQNGMASAPVSATACQWVAESPGKTLSFDGRDDYANGGQSSSSQWDAEGDITLEAWVKPASVGSRAEIVRHHSAKSQYSLALEGATGGYRWLAAVGSVCKQSKNPIATDINSGGYNWQHLAAVYNQSYALQFEGEDYLEVSHNPTLDIGRDLTVEAFVKVTAGRDMGIIAKGKQGAGMTYALYLTGDGRVVFAFDDKEGESRVYKTYTNTISVNQFYKIAVTKRQQVKAVKEKQPGFELTNVTVTKGSVSSNRDNIDDAMRADYLAGQKAANAQPSEIADSPVDMPAGGTVQHQLEVVIYVNGRAVLSQKLDKKVAASGNSDPVEIGKMTNPGNRELYFQGGISEVRLWNAVRDKTEIGKAIQGREEGLVSWWRLEENEGNVAYDSKSENHAAIIGAEWIENPDPQGSSLTLYQDGIAVEAENASATPGTVNQFTLGAYQSSGSNFGNYFQGTMEELRIWKTARTEEQVQDNIFTRLKGEKEDLIAYYTFDRFDREASDLSDLSLRGNDLTLGSGTRSPNSIVSDAPISSDTAIVRSALAGVETQFHSTIDGRPAVQEYGDLQYDAESNLTGTQKRCYSYIKDDQWHLLTGYKVGNLVVEWVGQAQANPQIIGYIEGAPPVPSENLTSTTMKTGEYEDYGGASAIELVEADSVNYIYSSSKETGFDMSMEMKAVLGFKSGTEAGFGLYTSVEETNIVAGLKGNMETSTSQMEEASASYGRNTTKTSHLQLSGAWEQLGSTAILPGVGRRFIPNNVGYALVQSDTMDIFALRLAHNNALVAYRYQPNPDIPKDWNIITFPINNSYTKQGTLDGKVGCKEDGSVQPDSHYPNAATYGQWSYFKPIEAYSIKRRIEEERQELESYYQQYSSEQKGSQAGAAIGALLGGPLGAVVGSAAGGVADSGTNIPKDLASRNIFNTYVWTAAGGFFSESTEVMESVQESTTGSFSLEGKAGLAMELNTAICKVAVGLEMEALFGGHIETIKTKSKETEKSFSLELEVTGDGDLQLYVSDAEKTKYPLYTFDSESGGAYDQQGNPVKRPGKVDAYRFMTFYLEPTEENFEDFFNKVVNPIWLDQSSDPAAVALRQADQTSKKPKCWRVFHRVTYVSRVLPEIEANNAPPVEKAMRAANVESNYELLKILEPFVKNKTQNFVAFSDAVRETVDLYLPELASHKAEIIKYAALYFGVSEEV